MPYILGELFGTAVLIIFGNGVVASASFKNMFAKNNRNNWVLITLAWGLAVLMGVITAVGIGAPTAYLNPAVAVFDFVANVGKEGVNVGHAVLSFVLLTLATFVGAALGQAALNFINWRHIKENDAAVLKGSSCTGPSHRDAFVQNFSYELLGTLLLIGLIVLVGRNGNAATPELGFVGHFGVTAIVMAIGMSLGSVTGYAINPARDLSPRLVFLATQKLFGKHIQNHTSADLSYGLSVPFAAPLLGGLIVGALTYLF
ncbi:aquaporin family protein [Mycoplasma sp. Ms02]|nr:aquaporin family protein [Mycoplasma sp. Ms02]